jgi:hypothetical protein
VIDVLKISFIILVQLISLASCSYTAERTNEQDDIAVAKAENLLDSVVVTRDFIKDPEIPADGKYQYAIAFAEWEGKSMGEEVLIEIAGDSIRVIYAGKGKLSLTVPGETLEEGLLRKHKSGVWIIAHAESDVEIDEIGGCTGGPTIIDFKNKKYWLC